MSDLIAAGKKTLFMFETSAVKLKDILAICPTTQLLFCDLEEQLLDKRKHSCFALQVDKATDSYKGGLVIAYVRFVNLTAGEDILFCEYAKSRATADELFNIDLNN